MQIICDFFKKAPETEAYFIDIILLLKKAFNLIKNKSVLNAKSALLKIDFKNLIKKGKEMVESIKITNHDEILIRIVLSEVAKFCKYDWLLEQIKKMLFKLEITHMNKKIKFKIFCFCGDHSFLQDVFNLPKSFIGEGGSCCRTCLIEGRNFKNILKCEEANKIDILRKKKFSSALEYPLNEYSDSFHDILEGILGNVFFVIVQKMTFYDNNYQRLPNVTMNWNPQLALGRALLYLMTENEYAFLFENVNNEVLIASKKSLSKILKIYYIINTKNDLTDNNLKNFEILINNFLKYSFEYVVDEAKCSMKFYSLLHYPIYAKRYRNFVAISCIRFESKNRIIKKLYAISNNKKNPAYTVIGKIGLIYLINNEINNTD
ncbi:Hypothetical protein SRAE_0000070500 [Strongyloides ratti]|uniref:Uncharacterized protein n=1 Tax=Strongyloides ratti TaxID=34506 RepID=A0A090L0C1_STRRB|nr:Hypothetical protein SRAE_0000070500 [Strongyloides ratti]CEF61587.1 Hypothetical protein SRAE_0000070500 [Strongyloides ratti]